DQFLTLIENQKHYNGWFIESEVYFSIQSWAAALTSENLNQWLLAYEIQDRSPKTVRSEEHTSELQSRENIVCRPLLEKKYYLIYLFFFIIRQPLKSTLFPYTTLFRSLINF